MGYNFCSNSTFAQILVVALIISNSINASADCKVSQLNGSSSKFVIQPFQKKVYSSFPSEGVQIRSCSSDVSHIILSKNTVFQYLNSRSQSINKLSDLNVSQNCGITNMPDSFSKQKDFMQITAQTKIKNDYDLLKTCVLFEVGTQSARDLEIVKSDECSIVSENPADKTLLLKGERCVVDYRSNDLINVKLKIAESCKSTEFYKLFEAQDVLTQFMVHSAQVSKTKKSVDLIEGNHSGPELSRQVVFKFLPDPKSFITTQDEITKIKYPSVLNFDFHQGSVSIRSVGNKTRFDFEYLVKNISNQYCDQGLCTRGSNSYNPVVAKINVYKIESDQKAKLLNTTPFYAPIIVPSQWSGILELSDRSLFLGNRSSIYSINQNIKEGDHLKIETEFFDAKYAFDNLLSDADTEIKFEFDSASNQDVLPSLPALAAPAIQYKLLSLPLLNMDQNAILKELNNFALDMNGVMTHSFSKICNEQNQCTKISVNKPIQKISTDFYITSSEYGLSQISNIKTKNTSLIQESSEMTLDKFPALECK